MQLTRRRGAFLPTTLALFPLLVLGCSSGEADDSQGAPKGDTPASAEALRPVKGLGNIIVAGRAVTGSKPSGHPKVPYQRTYTAGSLYASVTGFRSMAFGRAGLEGVYDDVLTAGTKGDGDRSGHVITTIRPKVQTAAADALRSSRGAAVALDAENGSLLAVVSTPSYDPASFSGNSGADEDAWNALNAGRMRAPLRNIALRDDAAPHETFHIVVAAAALEKGLYRSVDEATRAPLPYTPPGADSELTGNAACAGASIRTALRYSCDNVFAAIAVRLGSRDLAATARAFGFNEKVFVPERVWESTFPTGDMTDAEVAMSGIGLGEVRVTALKMAEVMAVVANGGRSTAPSLVDSILLGDGTVQKPEMRGTPSPPHQVVSQNTAAQIQSTLKDASGGKGTVGLTGWVAPARTVPNRPHGPCRIHATKKAG